MAGSPAVRVTGAKELQRALKKMGEDAGELTEINKAAAEIVAGEARNIVPVKSGRLRASIKSRATRRRGRVASGLVYSGVQHFGWPAHGIEPHPFLYDALDRRRGEVVRAYTDRVESLVRRIDRETPG